MTIEELCSVLVSQAFSSGSSIDPGGVAASDGGLVRDVDGSCVWRGVSCTWPAVIMLTVAVLVRVSDDAMDRIWSARLAVGSVDNSGGGGRVVGGGGGGGGVGGFTWRKWWKWLWWSWWSWWWLL